MVGFEEERERERLPWLSKLFQQAFNLSIKENPRPKLSFLLNILKNKDRGLARERQKKGEKDLKWDSAKEAGSK